jgi:hypothetical protein
MVVKKHEDKIACQACVHFYITWDKDFPSGCKAMGFKSRQAPSEVVAQSSGMPCQRFEKKVISRDSS